MGERLLWKDEGFGLKAAYPMPLFEDLQ